MSARPDSLPSNEVANRQPLPGSRKVYVSGPAGMRVPFREIALSASRGARGEREIHAPLRVYDTSGPYTDPEVPIDLTAGLPELRRPWILTRGPYGEIGPPPTLQNFRRLLGFGLFGFDPLYPLIIARSLALAAGTTAACIVAAFPLAFFIAALPARFKNIALTLVVVPFWTNLLIRTYAWQILFAPDGALEARSLVIFGRLRGLGFDSGQTPSKMAATPMPPAVQIEIRPLWPPPLCRSLAKTARIRAPVAAKGCPKAIDDPLTLSFARSIDPKAWLRPSRRRQ